MNRRRRESPARLQAAALRYRRESDPAPRLVAKGSGELARRIIDAAREAGVPVHEDPGLAALLMTMDIGREIPPELYVTVAEVLAFVYRVNGIEPDSPPGE